MYRIKFNILRIERRREIYNCILNNPGLHLGEISRKLEIPKSTLYYHLNFLEKYGFIVKRENGRYVHYYITNNIGEEDKKIIGLLRQEMPYKIILYLFSNPESCQRKISRHLNRHPTTIAFHLEKLDNLETLDKHPIGNKIQYKLRDSNYLTKLLMKYNSNFLYDISKYNL